MVTLRTMLIASASLVLVLPGASLAWLADPLAASASHPAPSGGGHGGGGHAGSQGGGHGGLSGGRNPGAPGGGQLGRQGLPPTYHPTPSMITPPHGFAGTPPKTFPSPGLSQPPRAVFPVPPSATSSAPPSYRATVAHPLLGSGGADLSRKRSFTQPPKPETLPNPGSRTVQGLVNQARVHPTGLPTLSGWNRALKGQDRDAAASTWRTQNRDFDKNAPWKHEDGWWRHHHGWRYWTGWRFGYFFFPYYGYVRAPAEYWDAVWDDGDYLPGWFWDYQVADYWQYGLPAPPDGCAWVWAGRDLALIDLSDGYILDIVHDVW